MRHGEETSLNGGVRLKWRDAIVLISREILVKALHLGNKFKIALAHVSFCTCTTVWF